MVVPVATAVVKVTTKAGVNPLNGIKGASQGIIQGAIETQAELNVVTEQIIKAAREAATQARVSDEAAVDKAAEGILEAAETLIPKDVARVKESLPTDTSEEANKQSVI